VVSRDRDSSSRRDIAANARRKIHCVLRNVRFNETMSVLNYNHLRYFWVVAHDGNLTRAARRLNLSQSALSVQIRKLEERLGHALFERRGRELVLTEAGRIALDHADAIFAAGEELLDSLRETGRARQALRVGALATLSRNFVLGFLRPVLGRADVEVILRSGGPAELRQALTALDLDVALVNRAPPSDAAAAFVTHRLATQAVSLVGAPARVRPGATLPDLLRAHPVILPTAESGVRLAFDALADRLGVRPQIAAEVDDMAMMRLLAREDVGLAVLPPIVVTDELAAGLLVEADRLPEVAEAFYAVTAARRFPNPLVRTMLDAAEAERAGRAPEA
jgi:LysR family transcriptional activator of nhaA